MNANFLSEVMKATTSRKGQAAVATVCLLAVLWLQSSLQDIREELSKVRERLARIEANYVQR